MYQEALVDVTDTSLSESKELIDAWNTQLKHAVKAVKHAVGGGTHGAAALADEHVSRLKSGADGLYDTLLRKEVATHETVEAMMDVFDSAMAELRAAKLVQHDVFFRALEGQVAMFAEGIQKHGQCAPTRERGWTGGRTR